MKSSYKPFLIVVCAICCVGMNRAQAQDEDFDDIARTIISTGKTPGSYVLKSLMGEVLTPKNGVVNVAAQYAMAEMLLHVAKNEASTKEDALKFLFGEKLKEADRSNGFGAYNCAMAIVLYHPESAYSLAAFQLAEDARRFAEKEYGEKYPSLTEFGYPDKLGDTSKKLSRKKN